MAGVVDLIGEDMDGKTDGEPPGPGSADEKRRRQPADQGQFIGMEEEKISVVFMVIGSLEEFPYPGKVDAELEEIFKEMIEIDENPRSETGQSGGERS